MLPDKYKYLETIGTLPKMLQESITLLGLKEVVGKGSNPLIMKMAKALGIDDIYTDDDMAWCAVVHCYLCFLTGKPLPKSGKGYDLLRANSFTDWGEAVSIDKALIGDTCVIKRKGGFHVFLIVASTPTTFHGIGGNQGNKHSIAEFSKKDVVAVRRLYRTGLPQGAVAVTLSSSGQVESQMA